jgi:transposase
MGQMEAAAGATMLPETVDGLREERMVQEDRWEEIRRLHGQERMSVTEIGRRLDLDRKTVRRCLRAETWAPYRRAARAATMLTPFLEGLAERVVQVKYSAQVLFQELRNRGYEGSYETVKRFVQPLREAELLAERATVRFETGPGEQSQIDWGSSGVYFRHEPVVLHLFILTLGYCRRSFYDVFRNEQMPQFLDAHERAFEHFGGHTREHLYDRMRTVCQVNAEGRTIWNPTFRSFADYWGFEPRLCRPYRAQTKGKVESGVKYVKRNFLVGRDFIDMTDVREQLQEWTLETADVRIHGTTHERPIDRFETEQPRLMPMGSRPGYRLEARYARIVADDYLVSLDTNRYSVPFALIGQTVEIERRGGEVKIFQRGQLVVAHPELTGRYQMRVLPEHGPGASARNQRLRRPTPAGTTRRSDLGQDVEIRDLGAYERLCLAEVEP